MTPHNQYPINEQRSTTKMDRDHVPGDREFTSTAQLADHLNHYGFRPARPRPDRAAALDGGHERIEHTEPGSTSPTTGRRPA